MGRATNTESEGDDWADTITQLITKAEDGLVEEQFQLGLMYSHGQGVKQDYSKAREWWEKAAKQEYADAQYNLGLMYATGKGVKQDYSKARAGFEKAAKQGDAAAQFNLGNMY